jgi:hypothetical protein
VGDGWKVQNNVSQINPLLYISICNMVGVNKSKHISRLGSLIVIEVVEMVEIVETKKIITDV